MNHVGWSDVCKQSGKFLSKNFRGFELITFQVVLEEAIQRAWNMACHRIKRFILSLKAISRARIDDGFALRSKIIKNFIDQNQPLVRHRLGLFSKRSRGTYCCVELPLP